jgi:hypothetical protein
MILFNSEKQCIKGGDTLVDTIKIKGADNQG